MLRRSLSVLLFLAAAMFVGCPGESYDAIVGQWNGMLDVSVTQLRIRFNFSVEEGKLVATIDSPDQNATRIPVQEVSWDGGRVKMKAMTIYAEFEGEVGEDSVLRGTWKQGQQEFPLALARVPERAAFARPQDPGDSVPYLVDDNVRFENRPARISLSATATRPEPEGVYPGVMLISGSGPQDRNSEVFGHRPFAVLADHLTREGVFVLRYDDRGVERSGGKFEEATPDDFASDVNAGVRYLERRKDVDDGRIGLIGHSEGGILAAMVASQAKEVKFIVLLATPAVPGEQTLYLQGEALMRANGASEEAISGNQRIQRAIFDVVKQGLEPDETYRRVVGAIEEEMAKLPEETQQLLSAELTPQAVDAQARAVSTEWFRDFITFDPADALRKVKVPVLALYGGKDLQVPPGPNVEALRAAMRRAGNSDLTVVELPGLNHLFQTADKGTVDEYSRIEETFAPAAMDAVADWIDERFGNPE